MNYWPYIVIAVLFLAMIAFSLRNRRRQVEQESERSSRIGVGTEVMTTSGLYGTVVAKHDDGTVQLAIAPGIEVKWASAALRDAPSLSDTYRRALDPAGGSAFDRPDTLDEPGRSGVARPSGAAGAVDFHKIPETPERRAGRGAEGDGEDATGH